MKRCFLKDMNFFNYEPSLVSFEREMNRGYDTARYKRTHYASHVRRHVVFTLIFSLLEYDEDSS